LSLWVTGLEVESGLETSEFLAFSRSSDNYDLLNGIKNCDFSAKPNRAEGVVFAVCLPPA